MDRDRQDSARLDRCGILEHMKNINPPLVARDRLTVRIAHFFEASATGWAVVTIPLILCLTLAAALLALALQV